MISVSKTVIITGGNTGLGFHTARHIALADKSWHILLACRNASKAESAVQYLISRTGHQDISWLGLDLASLSSVRNFVSAFREKKFPPLFGVICNAGIALGDRPEFSPDGIEVTFATNHLGHYLLVHLLSPYIESRGRVIFVSSELHRSDGPMKSFLPEYSRARALAFPEAAGEPVRHSGSHRYATTKLCNVLCAYEFARRFGKMNGKKITVNAMNPGMMPDTGLGGLKKRIFLRVFMKFILPVFKPGVSTTPEKSGLDLASLLASEDFKDLSGRYFDGTRQVPSSDESYDLDKALDLWNASFDLAKIRPEETILR